MQTSLEHKVFSLLVSKCGYVAFNACKDVGKVILAAPQSHSVSNGLGFPVSPLILSGLN